MTSDERIQAGHDIGESSGTRIHCNGCQYPIGFETPRDNDEECTDLEMVFDQGTDHPTLILPMSEWQIIYLLSQIKDHRDYEGDPELLPEDEDARNRNAQY